jgi:SsrA-binding protein
VSDAPHKVICANRRARFQYHIDETFEAGLELKGSEVKSLRQGRAHLTDAYARFRDNELYLLKAHIEPYAQARDNHEPERERKLLLHRRELQKLRVKIRERGFTLIPLELYFKGSHAKAKLALARGKKAHDKREVVAKRESDMRLRKIVKRERRRS